MQDIRVAYGGEFRGLSRVAVSFEELVAVRGELVDLLKRELTEDERRFLLSINLCEPRWEFMGIGGLERLLAIR